MILYRSITAVLLTVITCIATAADSSVNRGSMAVASAHPLATDAGIEILKMGGNAFDAAVAVSAALAVVEPYSSGFGGGGFWLLHIAESGREVMIDGREKAPLAATRNMYLDANGEVLPGASINGPLSAGIPGMPAALEHIGSKYGKLPLTASLKHAINYAKNGFEVDSHYKKMASVRLQALKSSEDATNIFLRDSQVPDEGVIIRQTQLAETIEKIASDGASAFYSGDIADRLVKSVRKHGGIWQLEDLSRYTVVERSPEVIVYKGMRFVTASPPSSGGVALSEMLNMLSFYDLDAMDDVERIHIIVEVMRRAYRDRAEYLGDPDHVDVPVDYLTSVVYTNKLIKTIQPNKATPSTELKPVLSQQGNGADTTHFSIIDRDGNRVSATLSINYPFGSGFVAEKTGILLNDEMDDFSAKPGEPNVYGLIGAEANSISPEKRMLSSMSPSFLETSDRVAILGTPGGSRIISMLLLATLDFYKGATAKHMVDLGRFHHQYLPDKIFYEPGVLSASALKTLMNMGHDTEELSSTYGNMQAIVIDKKTKRVEAASDPRGTGKALVVDD